jgi:hypothetical protein
MPLIIEFIGHGGSGKSFLSRQLCESLGEDSILFADIEITKSDVISFITKYPLLIVSIIMFVLGTRQNSLRRTIRYINMILKYNIRLSISENMDKKYIIVDEGMLHKLRSIRDTSRIKSIIYNDIKAEYREKIFSHADIVIHVVASVETINIRKLKRYYGEVDSAMIREGLEIIKDDIVNRAQYTERDIAAAMNEHEFTYIKVDNDGNGMINNMISEIKECINNLSETEQTK